ncbi:MAG: ORF6N domain-containing protein [Paludibacteraceae bacterium]|nr:ORF6N domain-containing protein [Paludibacteraceae bacterium]
MQQKCAKASDLEALHPKVYVIRGQKVVLDRDLAAALGVETRVINQKVKRNINLFNEDSMFQLTLDDCVELEFSGSKSQNSDLTSQNVISNSIGKGGSRHLPIVYTKEGVSMLEKLLKRDIPIEFEDEIAEAEVLPESWSEGTVVLYQPNENLTINVRVENETVWLTQEQMCILFGVNRNTISHHISNIFKEKELEKISVCQYFRHTATDGKTYTVTIYNLDVIISVGYRVKSLQGTWFRQWANKVIKEHLLNKGSLERRVIALEEQTKAIIVNTENRLCAVEQKVDFVVDTKLPPIEMIFYEGENFKAYDFLCTLIESAQKRIVLIDNYIDRKTLIMLNKRKEGVSATVYTHYKRIQEQQFLLDIDEANRNRPAPLIEVTIIKNDHDRFLIIDETVYHLGPSVKDAGVKRCAVIKMISTPDKILKDLILRIS